MYLKLEITASKQVPKPHDISDLLRIIGFYCCTFVTWFSAIKNNDGYLDILMSCKTWYLLEQWCQW